MLSNLFFVSSSATWTQTIYAIYNTKFHYNMFDYWRILEKTGSLFDIFKQISVEQTNYKHPLQARTIVLGRMLKRGDGKNSPKHLCRKKVANWKMWTKYVYFCKEKMSINSFIAHDFSENHPIKMKSAQNWREFLFCFLRFKYVVYIHICMPIVRIEEYVSF